MKLEGTYGAPDSDNDISTDITAVIENETESVIELAKTSVILVNSEGVTVGGSHDDEEEVFIDSKDSAKIDVRTAYNLNAVGFEGKLDQIKAFVDVQLYRREFHNLGEIEIPKNHSEASFIKKGVDIAGLIKVIGVTCTRSKPDEDGEIDIKLAIGIRNISDTYFERVTAKFGLFDQEGAEIDRDDTYHSLAPHSGRILEPSCYRIKSGRVKNCVGKLTIHVHQPVASFSEDIVLTEED
jgi:hypothetical protein